MKNERILHVDDKLYVREGIRHVIESWADEEGHQIIGSAASATEVEKLFEQGIKPTVALVDNRCPNEGDGELIAGIIKKFSPETVVVSLSSSENVTWGNYNLQKSIGGSELVNFLTNLQH
jgi:DNA-binding NarL/FixJ family response regulator